LIPERKVKTRAKNLPSRGSAAVAKPLACATNDRQFILGKRHARKGYLADIEKLTKENDSYRQVLDPGQNLQFVLMALKPGQDTGKKTLRLYTIYGPPNHVDQFVEKKKSQALASTEIFDDLTSE
jgi:hypothetical protein